MPDRCDQMIGEAERCWLVLFHSGPCQTKSDYARFEAFGPVLVQTQRPRTETLVAICDEVCRARVKFPGRRFLLAALTEELGELAQAYLQRAGSHAIRKEAIQVACLAIRIIEEGDASFDDLTDDEAKL